MKNSSLRAITTRYKGYAFRSRLEARWAVFFDHLGIRWEYEPEGFELGNGLRYLPDFWLPDWKMWVEVKPDDADDPTREKATRLSQQSRYPVFVTAGMPGGGGCMFATPINSRPLAAPCEVSWGDLDGNYAWVFTTDRVPNSMHFCIGGTTLFATDPDKSGTLSGTRTSEGVAAARSARFEFGEKGGAK